MFCNLASVLLLSLSAAISVGSHLCAAPLAIDRPANIGVRLTLLNPPSADHGFLVTSDSVASNLPVPAQAEKKSLLYTLLPLPTLVLTVPALIAGPSAGYFYGGLNGRAWAGIGIRTLALGGMFSAFGICGWDCGPGESAYNIAWAVFIGSGAILAGSAIYDIATVKEAVRNHNARGHQSLITIYPGYAQQLGAFTITLSKRF